MRAESARLDVLKHAMPDAAQDWIGAQVWAYELAAAFLESLGAPEKVQGYIPANAGGMARELAAQDSESPNDYEISTRTNGRCDRHASR